MHFLVCKLYLSEVELFKTVLFQPLKEGTVLVSQEKPAPIPNLGALEHAPQSLSPGFSLHNPKAGRTIGFLAQFTKPKFILLTAASMPELFQAQGQHPCEISIWKE